MPCLGLGRRVSFRIVDLMLDLDKGYAARSVAAVDSHGYIRIEEAMPWNR